MGRIIGYVVLLSNLSLVLAVQHHLKPFHEKKDNSTQLFPRDPNAFSNRRTPPSELPNKKRTPQMLTSLGLNAYSSDDSDRNPRKRNPSDRNHRRNVPPPYSQNLYPRRNSKQHLDFPSQRLTRLKDHSHSGSQQSKRFEDLSRRYQKEGRIARYHSAKVCDPCNSVPWVPLLKVSDSYRQQRTHVTELHTTPQQNFNLDYHGYASDTHNILLPPVPLPPPIFDGTISSSFGLPIGNIPTGHGLLAPIHHLSTDFSKYSVNTIDYSNSFNYYSPHGLLENNNFPELSPVPVVPIHDSGQFFQFDSVIPDLVPPPSKDVSKVVLTISEDQNPPDRLPHNHKEEHNHKQEHNLSKEPARLEIVKSIPIAEFTSVQVAQQQLPLYPPLQSEFSSEHEFHAKKTSSDGFLVPPPPQKLDSDVTNDSTEHLEQATAPKPLTSSSLSWLFSDHTAPPSESTAPVTSFATDAQEIASVVNNELRPVSPHPAVEERNVGAGKSRKVQIIIPYTTKTKSGHDNNALESVQHEVYRPPAKENSESATSVLSTSKERSDMGKGYLSEMHHIIASNIRELLREEIEKAQKDQNYPLQNNIDNWTALEYSNHKTVGSKTPKEVIAQALAVTSIPGTSISHLLLPSKKIPKEYFVTTPIPIYDEPSTLVYKADNSSVNSRPFTAKPYASTSVYNPTKESNHEGNYTDVDRGRVNVWGKLNENLVLPEARSRTVTAVRSSSTGKVQIVTPVSVFPERNHTIAPFRRTTRHVRPTETSSFWNKLNSTKLEKVNSSISAKMEDKVNSSVSVAVEDKVNSSVSVAVEDKVNSSVSVAVEDKVTEESPQDGRGEQLSINDVFPFRNKELPWESGQNRSQPASRMGRQRKSLIKQVNLQRAKAAVGSS